MRSTPSAEISSADGGSTVQRALLWAFLALWVLPPLFFSSSEYVLWARLLGALLVLPLTKEALPQGWNGLDVRWKLAITGLLVAHLASGVGGWRHGDEASTILKLAAGGLLGVFGLCVGLALLLTERWKAVLKIIGWLVLLPPLIVSLIGYFVPIERYLEMGPPTLFYEPIRLCLLWPTRIAMAGMGQLGWEHANHASLIFAVAWVAIIESLASAGGKWRQARWLVAGALLAAIFLTGSRNGFLIIAAAIPFLVFKRPFRFSGKIVLLLLASITAGYFLLEIKEAKIAAATAAPPPAVETGAPPPPPPAYSAPDLHTKGLLERGSAGRLDGYRRLWIDLEGYHWTGKGLEVTGSWVNHLNHEHSSYLATFRGGGFVALAGHFLVLTASGFAALSLFRKGCRWPLVILVAVLAGLLVDHTSVIRLGGRHEFLLHWVAVLLPLILVIRKPYHSPLIRAGSSNSVSSSLVRPSSSNCSSQSSRTVLPV